MAQGQAPNDTPESRHNHSNPENAYYEALYSAMSEADLATQADGDERTDKRADYWSWKQFHMSVAFLSAKRSRDPNTKVLTPHDNTSVFTV